MVNYDPPYFNKTFILSDSLLMEISNSFFFFLDFHNFHIVSFSNFNNAFIIFVETAIKHKKLHNKINSVVI